MAEKPVESLSPNILDPSSTNRNFSNDEFYDAVESNNSDCVSEESGSEVENEIVEKEKTESEESKEERKQRALELKDRGNSKFRSEEFLEARKLYTRGLKNCPLSLTSERSMLYNNRAATELKLGLKERALKDCNKAISLNPTYVKALLRRAKVYEELDQLSQALEDYKTLATLEPNNPEVKTALIALPIRIEEQTEKLKAEMLGKMKDLGNMFLKPFGLSTDNFKINQDPTTGSYSVNMSK